MGKILLYYKYVTIDNPPLIVAWQKRLCQGLALRGRILISTEGINGTVGGSQEATAEYKKQMLEHPLFTGIDFKEAEGDEHYFPKLRVALRKEIVTMGIDPEELTVEHTGDHLKPQQVHELLANKPDNLVVMDTRNTYESRIGQFKDAVIPDIKNFREFPAYIDQHLDELKDKEVLMYCTGGVRCERASAYLNKKNVAKKVYQIEGGIDRYIEQFPDGFFRGKNYVFDGRVEVRANSDVLSNCDLCPTACDNYTNCVNMRCNNHFIACEECLTKYDNNCSAVCFDLVTQKKVPRRSGFRPMTRYE